MDIEKAGKDILDASFAIHSRSGGGFVINFGMPSLRNGIERIVKNLPTCPPSPIFPLHFPPALQENFAHLANFA